MSINRLNTNLTLEAKIKALNDMILELNGMVAQGKFDKNENIAIITDMSLDTKFYRDEGLGNTIATYSGWSHQFAKTGYSIWKYSPTNYSYNEVNQVFMNNKILVNMGEATSVSATAFDKVELYNGDSGSGYTDNTTEAATSGGTEFELMDSTTDYLYIGDVSTFNGIKLEFATRGSNYTLVFEYYNGDSGEGWTEFTPTDNTSGFISDGNIIWTDADVDSWGAVSIDGTSHFWIRISTTTLPVTTAEAYWIIPASSVQGLLALSSTQIFNEEWAWCSNGTDIYVTIRSAGASSYEGDYFIASASTTANKQNFFITNNPFTADYLDSTYSAASFGYSVAFRDSFVDGDLDGNGEIVFTHSLGKSPVDVTVIDNNKKEIGADDVTQTDTNNVTIKLDSHTPIPGTWDIVVIG